MEYCGFDIMDFPEWLLLFKENNPDLVIEERLGFEHYLVLTEKELSKMRRMGFSFVGKESFIGCLDPDDDPLVMRDLKEEYTSQKLKDQKIILEYLNTLC